MCNFPSAPVRLRSDNRPNTTTTTNHFSGEFRSGEPTSGLCEGSSKCVEADGESDSLAELKVRFCPFLFHMSVSIDTPGFAVIGKECSASTNTPHYLLLSFVLHKRTHVQRSQSSTHTSIWPHHVSVCVCNRMCMHTESHLPESQSHPSLTPHILVFLLRSNTRS